MKIAAAQMACTLGDLAANARKMRDFAERAKAAGAELVVFPEMADTGYAMDVIREQAKPWNEGVVPELQETARSFGDRHHQRRLGAQPASASIIPRS